MSPDEATIVISPLGEQDIGIIQAIRRHVQQAFSLTTETATLLQDVNFAIDPVRGQYHSTIILDKLASRAPTHCLKVLAITEVDLFIPILTYVYGEAQLGGKAAIVSTHRLREGLIPTDMGEAFLGRIAKEAVHELGHTFKLRHCPDKTCIMHYCRSIRDVDKKEDRLCRYCQILLNDEMERLGVSGLRDP